MGTAEVFESGSTFVQAVIEGRLGVSGLLGYPFLWFKGKRKKPKIHVWGSNLAKDPPFLCQGAPMPLPMTTPPTRVEYWLKGPDMFSTSTTV